MNSITEMITQYLTGGVASQINQRLGTDETTTRRAVAVAVPLLIAALARNSSQPEGAEALHQAVEQDHDGSILNNLLGLINSPQDYSGSGILGHVLGATQSNAETEIAKQSGLNPSSAGSLLEILAPVVMGTLGKQQEEQALSPNQLASYLNTESIQAQQSAPDIMGAVSNLLDANKDGSVADDLGNLAAKVFGRGQ
ncbi:MAG TPA: DUF937 domain-containing protein [Pyrinomonadaceae bacterium]|nr:DUF937 domain-containing protein [Pyrinomonadaceae bacterium]